jgi:hypothetical protein
MNADCPCRDGFLEWIGTTRREFAAVPVELRPHAKRVAFPAPWVYMYRCLKCCATFTSPLEPMAGPSGLLGAPGSVLA